MRIPLPRRHAAACQIRLHDIDLGRHRAIQQREVDGVAVPGALAGVQAGEDADRRIESRDDIGHGHAHFAGRPFRRPRDTHETAQGLNGKIVAGQVAQRSGAAKSGDGTDDEARIQVEEFFRR